MPVTRSRDVRLEAAARQAQIEQLYEQCTSLDILFLVDCTSSMGPYINAVQLQIFGIIDSVYSRFGASQSDGKVRVQHWCKVLM